MRQIFTTVAQPVELAVPVAQRLQYYVSKRSLFNNERRFGPMESGVSPYAHVGSVGRRLSGVSRLDLPWAVVLVLSHARCISLIHVDNPSARWSVYSLKQAILSLTTIQKQVN